jgi:hypothetical protein
MVEGLTNDKLEIVWKGAVVISSMYYHGTAKKL